MPNPPWSTAAASLPEWQSSRTGRWLALLLLGALVASWRLAEVRPLAFTEREALVHVWAFARAMFPPEYSLEFLSTIGKPILETVHMALLGTVFAALLGFPLALLATNSLFFAGDLNAMGRRGALPWLLRRIPYVVARLVLSLLRSIPELVWALLFVRALGLGTAPGVLALGVSYGGMLGKVYADILESVPASPLEALQSTGASRCQIVLYGWLPQVFPTMLGYTLYRWECALRAAALLGFVGAGGIGQQIELSMRMFAYHEAVSLILIIFALSAVVERVGDAVRRRLA